MSKEQKRIAAFALGVFLGSIFCLPLIGLTIDFVGTGLGLWNGSREARLVAESSREFMFGMMDAMLEYVVGMGYSKEAALWIVALPTVVALVLILAALLLLFQLCWRKFWARTVAIIKGP